MDKKSRENVLRTLLLREMSVALGHETMQAFFTNMEDPKLCKKLHFAAEYGIVHNIKFIPSPEGFMFWDRQNSYLQYHLEKLGLENMNFGIHAVLETKNHGWH